MTREQHGFRLQSWAQLPDPLQPLLCGEQQFFNFLGLTTLNCQMDMIVLKAWYNCRVAFRVNDITYMRSSIPHRVDTQWVWFYVFPLTFWGIVVFHISPKFNNEISMKKTAETSHGDWIVLHQGSSSLLPFTSAQGWYTRGNKINDKS